MEEESYEEPAPPSDMGKGKEVYQSPLRVEAPLPPQIQQAPGSSQPTAPTLHNPAERVDIPVHLTDIEDASQLSPRLPASPLG